MKEALVPDPQAWPCWMTLGWWSWWALASSVVLLFTNLLNFQVCFFANGHGSSCSDGPAGGVWHQLIPRLPRVLVIQGLQVLLEHVVVAQVALAEALEKVSLRVFANWIINSNFDFSRFHLLLLCPHVFWCGWWKLCWCSRGGGVSCLCGVRGLGAAVVSVV